MRLIDVRCNAAPWCGCGTPCDALPVSDRDVPYLDRERNDAPPRVFRPIPFLARVLR